MSKSLNALLFLIFIQILPLNSSSGGSSSSRRGGRSGASSSNGAIPSLSENDEKQRVLAELVRVYTKRTVDDYIKHHNCAVTIGQFQQQGSITIPNECLEFLEKSLSNQISSKEQLKTTKNIMIRDGSAFNEIKEYCEKYMGDIIEEIRENCKNKMKEFMYNDAVINGSTECSVCLEEFQEEEIIAKTKCNHYFHWDCISKNLKEGRGNFGKCPICRGEFDLDDNKDAVELNNKLKIVDLEFKGRFVFRLF